MEFNSFGGFERHLLRVATSLPGHRHRMLEKAAKLVVRTAQAKVGVYQPAIGPFSAWPPLAQSTMDTRESLGFPTNQPLLRTRELGDSYAYHVHGAEADIGSPLQKALWMEAGTKNAPPRPVVGPALAQNAEKIVHILGAGMVRAFVGGVMEEII